MKEATLSRRKVMQRPGRVQMAAETFQLSLIVSSFNISKIFPKLPYMKRATVRRVRTTLGPSNSSTATHGVILNTIQQTCNWLVIGKIQTSTPIAGRATYCMYLNSPGS